MSMQPTGVGEEAGSLFLKRNVGRDSVKAGTPPKLPRTQHWRQKVARKPCKPRQMSRGMKEAELFNSLKRQAGGKTMGRDLSAGWGTRGHQTERRKGAAKFFSWELKKLTITYLSTSSHPSRCTHSIADQLIIQGLLYPPVCLGASWREWHRSQTRLEVGTRAQTAPRQPREAF